MSTSLEDLLAAREDIHKRRPRWLGNVIATGVSRRTNRVSNGDWNLAVAVPEKRRLRDLPKRDVIPSTVDGVPIDILGQVSAPPKSAPSPAAAKTVGSGSDIGGKHGKNGTATCVALSMEGHPVLVTTTHVVSASDVAFRWTLPNRPTIGVGGKPGVLALSGADLYGGAAAHPAELFQVEATRIDLISGLTVSGGIPDGSSFGVQRTVDLVDWLTNANVRSYGAASARWRTGFVRMLFPRRPDATLTGMCLVQETGATRSTDGDSGSLWVAEAQNGFVAVGLHWGFVWRSSGSPVYTFVTELEAALPELGIASLVGDASWTATT